ncbi:MAG TPA: recombinase family protein [Levilinea sp.]|nr:recombinase family protein [Levilinea sp.]
MDAARCERFTPQGNTAVRSIQTIQIVRLQRGAFFELQGISGTATAAERPQRRHKARSVRTRPIREMLKRYSYTGKIPYQGIDEQGRHRKRKPPLEVLEGNHPALVSEELFNKVQGILALVNINIRYKKGIPVRLFPLTGILKCGYCGSRMRGDKTFNDRQVYGDGDWIDHNNRCNQPMADSDVLEAQTYQFLHEVIENSQGIVDLDVLHQQIQIAEERFVRTRDTYISGEITRESFEGERNRSVSLKRDLC